MKILGISALSHDAAVCLIEDGELLFASQSERYSRQKNDPHLNPAIINEALSYGQPDLIAWYEKPWLKKSRQLYSGQWKEIVNPLNSPRRYLNQFSLKGIPLAFVDHHLSHIGAGFLTSDFTSAAGLVIDGVGEWDTVTIWLCDQASGFKRLKRISYPFSLGLLYSAFTQRLGLRPNEDEYILMGMAAYGAPKHTEQIENDFFNRANPEQLKQPVHLGIGRYLPQANPADLAASVQCVIESKLSYLVDLAFKLTGLENLVYMGGVALNCLANRLLFKRFSKVWIMPNPGDAGSSLGCAAVLGKKKLNWRGPYLGHCIPGEYPVDSAVKLLKEGKVVGLAKGRAEFGPRALGNRSLVTDPRDPEARIRVNSIKKRQQFRPFAPVIKAEKVADYFEMPQELSPYMQFVGRCREPERFPAICHVDGTSRVQTVNQEQHPGLWRLLDEFENRTSCPLLLNTSLNIRGEPMVNQLKDAERFSKLYNITVL